MKVIVSTILLLSLFSCEFAQEARKINEFGDLSCDGYLAALDHAISEVSDSRTSKIFVFVYEGKTKNERYNTKGDVIGYINLLPQIGQAKKRIQSIKQRLSFVRATLTDFVFIESRFREYFTVEFWLVPNSVTPPKPTPTVKKMKYRKGKPQGFCLGCC